MRKLVVGLITALALPATANAAESTYLSLDRARAAPGWTLSGSVVSAPDYAPTDIFGLTLSRSFDGGRGEESHALRGNHERSTLDFDGRTGRWRTTGQLGRLAAVDMRIVAAGAATAVNAVLGCRGELTRVPVTLAGVLRLRTRTQFFGTIRRARLTGTVTYANGPLDCRPVAAAPCERSSSLYAGSPRASLNASAASLTLQFSEALRVTSQGTVNWYHVMRVAGYDALIGAPPSLLVASPSRGPIQGTASFAGRTATASGDACPTRSTLGDASGSFRTSFVGWGARTLRLTPGLHAVYQQTG